MVSSFDDGGAGSNSNPEGYNLIRQTQKGMQVQPIPPFHLESTS